MRNATIDEHKKCPLCGRVEGQVKNGHNRSGTQQCFCKFCKKSYTLDPKPREYSDEVKQQAGKLYFSGVSARQVGRIFGMNKANILNWLKKNAREIVEK